MEHPSIKGLYLIEVNDFTQKEKIIYGTILGLMRIIENWYMKEK